MAPTIDIRDYLRTFYQGEPVYYYPNPGSAGDILIACASFQIFNDIDIEYRLVDWRTFEPSGKILLYGGGGNLVPCYDHAAHIIEKFHRRVKKLVILPHTISGNEKLLADLGGNVDIICREKVSYDHVKTYAHKANVILSEDLAFQLRVESVLSKDVDSLAGKAISELRYMFEKKGKYRSRLPAVKEAICFLKREALLFNLFKRSSEGVLSCFRTDKERTDICDNDNIDIMLKLSYGKAADTITEPIALWVSNQLLRFINHYGIISTNRLHAAIPAALLNKRVELYPNSYFKNEAVYRHSIENRFPNVRWMG